MLTTARLHIRPLQLHDVPTLISYRTDATVSRFQSWIPNESEAIAFIQHMPVFGTPNEWVQLALVTTTLIGDCAVKVFDNGMQAEVGITIAPQYQQQGFAKEALIALFVYLFKDLHRIIAYVAAENTASIALLQSLGMRREAHYVQSYLEPSTNLWEDEYLYAILEKE